MRPHARTASRVFDSLDENKDGSLSPEEVKFGVTADMGENVTDEEIKASGMLDQLQELDSNSDGQIGRDEFGDIYTQKGGKYDRDAFTREMTAEKDIRRLARMASHLKKKRQKPAFVIT